MNKVFVTGLGVVCPIGDNVEQYWKSILNKSTKPELGFKQYSNRINNRFIYTCASHLKGENINGRGESLASEAVRQAIKDASLNGDIQIESGIAVGTTMGDESFLEDSRDTPDAEKKRNDFPFQISASIANRFGLCGPNFTISNACTSGLYGMDVAANAIRYGDADLMIAGGVESSSRIVLSCFNRLGALDEGLCRPFDRDRQGTVLGEGAAFVVLESKENMKKRGQKNYYCEYKSSGWSCDAYQPTAPEPGGEQIERALRESLESSCVVPDDIDCILPHGTGTPLNDAVEASVLTKVFGNNKRLPIVTAIKSKLGHSGGAAGAFSVVTACLILKYGSVPTTANLKTRDAGLAFPIPVDAPMEHTVNNILVNAYAFGGNNISVVVGR